MLPETCSSTSWSGCCCIHFSWYTFIVVILYHTYTMAKDNIFYGPNCNREFAICVTIRTRSVPIQRKKEMWPVELQYTGCSHHNHPLIPRPMSILESRDIDGGKSRLISLNFMNFLSWLKLMFHRNCSEIAVSTTFWWYTPGF